MCTRLLRRPDNTRKRHTRITQGDILPDTAAEQDAFLLNDPDLMTQPDRIDQGKVHSVDQHPAVGGHMQSLYQFRECALA